MKPDEFFAQIKPMAVVCRDNFGIPIAITLAQAALESAWGESQLTKLANNLFGIKATPAWTGAVLTLPTEEYAAGKDMTTVASWREYPSALASVLDHAQFLIANPRYKILFKLQGPELWATALQTCGYSTDPQYATKLIEIMRAHDLIALDEPPAPLPPKEQPSVDQPTPTPAPPQPPSLQSQESVASQHLKVTGTMVISGPIVHVLCGIAQSIWPHFDAATWTPDLMVIVNGIVAIAAYKIFGKSPD